MAVETFLTRIGNREFYVSRGTRWRGPVVELHPQFFIAANEADEPTIAAARANLQAAVTDWA